ncbi:MAG: MFS transporter [Anaerolineae bacterium]
MNDQHPWLRRNLLLLMVDYCSFTVGFAFFDPLVVVPVFTRMLTGSGLAVGVLSALRIVFVTLPQVWAAGVLATSSRYKPLFLGSSIAGRLPVVILAVVVLFYAASLPWLVLAVLGLAVALFYSSEGLNSISWPAMFGKLLPATIRGRFLGMGQLVSSLGALAAGYLIQRILSNDGPPYPANWALMFTCASVGLFGSVLAIALLRERPDPKPSLKVDMRQSIATLARHVRDDSRLRRIVQVEILLGMASSVFPFIVLRAQDLVPQGQAAIGTFLIVQNLGGMAAAAVCGNVVDRVGSWAAVRLSTLVAALTLVLVMLAPILGAPYVVYLMAFALLGFVTGSSWWTFTTYLMDIAAEDSRPAYLAASGVLKSPVFVASLLAGGAYGKVAPEFVFGVALLFSLGALATSLTLERMRAGVPLQPS